MNLPALQIKTTTKLCRLITDYQPVEVKAILWKKLCRIVTTITGTTTGTLELLPCPDWAMMFGLGLQPTYNWQHP